MKETRKLRELLSNGVRCRWNPDHTLYPAELFENGEWLPATSEQLLDHAAVFTALREQPYEPESVLDDVETRIMSTLSETWDAAEDMPSSTGWIGVDRKARELARELRPLILASATVDALVDEFIRRGAIYYPASQHTWDGYPRLVLSAAECRPAAMPSTPESTR